MEKRDAIGARYEAVIQELLRLGICVARTTVGDGSLIFNLPFACELRAGKGGLYWVVAGYTAKSPEAVAKLVQRALKEKAERDVRTPTRPATLIASLEAIVQKRYALKQSDFELMNEVCALVDSYKKSGL